MKLDLLTNATVVDDAIRFVSLKSKENTESHSNNTIEDGKEELKAIFNQKSLHSHLYL